MSRIRAALRAVRRNGDQRQAGPKPDVAGAAVPVRNVKDDKVLEGKEGWLFLARDGNDVIGQLAGQHPLSDDALERWRSVLEERTETLGARGASYHFMVAPNTHSIYSELLPAGIEIADERPIEQLRAYLEHTGSAARVLYPLPQLLEEKRQHQVCTPTNSHWNELGGFVAYSMLMDEAERAAPVRRVSRDDLVFFDVDHEGDLGYKLTPARSSPHRVARLRHRSAELVYDNEIENTGSYVVTECPAAPPTCCVLFGDSYSYGLLRFLSESFRRFVFAQTVSIDLDVLERERPDVVLSVMSERFIVVTPHAALHGVIAETEKRKLAEGRVRPGIEFWNEPEVAAQRPQHIVSPENVERLRARLLSTGRPREAALVSTIAYAGLLGRDVLRLRWRHVGDEALEIPPGPDLAGRRVRLLRPLAEDLRAWRDASNPAGPRALVFPGERDGNWAPGEWQQLCERTLIPESKAIGLALEHPSELRHTFCSLLLMEGVEPREVAAQAGIPEESFVEIYFMAIVHGGRFGTAPADMEVQRARSRVGS